MSGKITSKSTVPPTGAAMTFGQLFDLYIEQYAKRHTKTWADTIENYRRYFSRWHKRRLDSIKRLEVQAWVDDLAQTKGKHCANRNYDTMRAVFSWALRKEVIEELRNPCLGVDKYKVRSRQRFVLPGEFAALAAAIDAEPNETIRDFFWLCLFTGARKANVLAMSWHDVNFELRTWTIPDTKNGDPQIVNLIDEAIKILLVRKNKAVCEWVFPSPRRQGHLICPKSAWKRLRERSGLKDLRIHDLRRTLGSYMAIQGTSPTIIAKALGHRSLQATAVYTRLTQDPVREAVENALGALIRQDKDG